MKSITISSQDGWVNLTASLSLESSKIYSFKSNDHDSTFWLNKSATEPSSTDIVTNSVNIRNNLNIFHTKSDIAIWAFSETQCAIAVYETFAGEANTQ
jgi:hypothetical protein